MIIQIDDVIYDNNLVRITYNQRKRLNGSDFDLLIAGGRQLLLYVAPTYDPFTQKLGALQDNLDNTCSESVVALSQGEIDTYLATHIQNNVETIRNLSEDHIINTLGWKDWAQRNIANGFYSEAVALAFEDVYNLTVVESNRCEALAEQNLPYTCTWPVTVDGAITLEEAKLL